MPNVPAAEEGQALVSSWRAASGWRACVRAARMASNQSLRGIQALGWAFGLSRAPCNLVDLSDGTSERICYVSGHTVVVLDRQTGQQSFLQVSPRARRVAPRDASLGDRAWGGGPARLDHTTPGSPARRGVHIWTGCPHNKWLAAITTGAPPRPPACLAAGSPQCHHLHGRPCPPPPAHHQRRRGRFAAGETSSRAAAAGGRSEAVDACEFPRFFMWLGSRLPGPCITRPRPSISACWNGCEWDCGVSGSDCG
jgi:hypothetical protein